MRDFVKEQLKKVNFADLKNFDETTNTYHIKKYSKPSYDIGGQYIVKLPKTIINNTTSVLATNWNKNLAPKDEYIRIYVSKVLGKMIYVDSISYDFENKIDTGNMFSGWLPVDEIEQIIKF